MSGNITISINQPVKQNPTKKGNFNIKNVEFDLSTKRFLIDGKIEPWETEIIYNKNTFSYLRGKLSNTQDIFGRFAIGQKITNSEAKLLLAEISSINNFDKKYEYILEDLSKELIKITETTKLGQSIGTDREIKLEKNLGTQFGAYIKPDGTIMTKKEQVEADKKVNKFEKKYKIKADSWKVKKQIILEDL